MKKKLITLNNLGLNWIRRNYNRTKNYQTKSLVEKEIKNPYCVDNILAKWQKGFQNSFVFDNKLSGFHVRSVPFHKPSLSKVNT